MGQKQEEADLILRLHEMRRDKKGRKAREWFDTEFNPQSAQDVITSAPDAEKRLSGWRELNKNWVERAHQEQQPDHGRSKG